MEQGVMEDMIPGMEEEPNQKHSRNKFNWTDYCAWRMVNKCGIGRQELADRVGCNPKTITDWFAGNTGFAEYADEKDVREKMGEAFSTACGNYAALYVFVSFVMPKFEALMRIPEEQAQEMREVFFECLKGAR